MSIKKKFRMHLRGVKALSEAHRKVLHSTSILSLGTLTSRLLGFVRDVMIAKIFGTGFQAEAFFVALKMPNMFRDFIGEGAIQSSVVPVLAEYQHKESKRDFWIFVHSLMRVVTVLLLVISAAGILLAPVLVSVLVPGFRSNPELFELTTLLTQIIFPYLFFIGLTAYAAGLLFSFGQFKAPAFSPCLLNVALIAALVIGMSVDLDTIYILAIGVLVGGVLQLVVLLPPLWKCGWRWYPGWHWRHPGVLKIIRLMGPRMIGSGVYQMTVVLDTFCASLVSIVGMGGVSAIFFANRLIQVPMGVFVVAMASAALPSLSKLANKKDIPELRKMISFAIEQVIYFMLPAMVILTVLAKPIIQVLFERGQFDAYSTQITSWTLLFYALGLMSFGGIKILVAAFHAFQDTRTPVKVAALCLIINALLNFTLMFPLKIGGIALSSAIAGTVDFIILYRIMERKVGGFEPHLRRFGLKMIGVSVLMALVMLGCRHLTAGAPVLIMLIFSLVSGLVVFILGSWWLKVTQTLQFLKWMPWL